MKDIRLGEVSKVIIAHKDRLVRFSFEFIEEFASWYGCEIIVAFPRIFIPRRGDGQRSYVYNPHFFLPTIWIEKL